MSPRKRKAIDFSEDLRERLLELAGIVVKKEVGSNKNIIQESANGEVQNNNNSTSEAENQVETAAAATKTEEKVKAKSSSELRREAVKLKHRGDELKGPLKHLIYLRAGLKFLEHAVSVEPQQQAKQYQITGEYIGSIAEVAEQAAKTSEKKGEIEHFVILNYKFAAIALMRSFAIRSVKLKQVTDMMLSTKFKNSNRVPGTGSEDSEHLKYFVKHMNDILRALHLWRKAGEYLSELNEQGDLKVKGRINALPPLELYLDADQVLPVIESVRNCVNNMY